jgi:hypothetical protein
MAAPATTASTIRPRRDVAEHDPPRDCERHGPGGDEGRRDAASRHRPRDPRPDARAVDADRRAGVAGDDEHREQREAQHRDREALARHERRSPEAAEQMPPAQVARPQLRLQLDHERVAGRASRRDDEQQDHEAGGERQHCGEQPVLHVDCELPVDAALHHDADADAERDDDGPHRMPVMRLAVDHPRSLRTAAPSLWMGDATVWRRVTHPERVGR